MQTKANRLLCKQNLLFYLKEKQINTEKKASPGAVGAPSLEVPMAMDGALGSLSWGVHNPRQEWNWMAVQPEVFHDSMIL